MEQSSLGLLTQTSATSVSTRIVRAVNFLKVLGVIVATKDISSFKVIASSVSHQMMLALNVRITLSVTNVKQGTL